MSAPDGPDAEALPVHRHDVLAPAGEEVGGDRVAVQPALGPSGHSAQPVLATLPETVGDVGERRACRVFASHRAPRPSPAGPPAAGAMPTVASYVRRAAKRPRARATNSPVGGVPCLLEAPHRHALVVLLHLAELRRDQPRAVDDPGVQGDLRLTTPVAGVRQVDEGAAALVRCRETLDHPAATLGLGQPDSRGGGSARAGQLAPRGVGLPHGRTS